MKFIALCVLVLSSFNCCNNYSIDDSSVYLSWNNNLKLLKDANKTVTFSLSDVLKEDIEVTLNTSHVHSAVKGISPIIYPTKVILPKNVTNTLVPLHGSVVGQIVIEINTTSKNICLPQNPKLRVYVVHSHELVIFNTIVGWMYFVAWSVSFYPQVILNYQRKSVVGLNFDYIAYNITGFIAYCLYNIGLFWIPEVQNEYLHRFPDGVNPVQANDVFFTLHACLLTAITIVQCFMYERGGQKVSKLATVLLVITWIAMVALLFVSVAQKITWLDYLMVFSYVKLGVTLIKYMPQVYMNYRRKSTIGWSIGNVLLDLTGGSLSILQMILQSYNNDEWDLIFGDPTKFGLGVFSIFFDIIFIVQHYILYRKTKVEHVGLLDDDVEDE